MNPENAQSFWRPDYKGMDWQDYTNMGKEISEMFLGFLGFRKLGGGLWVMSGTYNLGVISKNPAR